MPSDFTTSRSAEPDSPLLRHLISQLTVIKAQAQMIGRRTRLSNADEAYLAEQERSIDAIEKAVARAMAQLVSAGERGRMPPEPLERLVESEDVA